MEYRKANKAHGWAKLEKIKTDCILVILKNIGQFISLRESGIYHGRTGRGGEGGCSPPKFWATQIFWAAREIWAKPVFKEVSVLFFSEEIDIFYFNLKSAW